ncbi:insulinase family protein [Rheinheimera sp. UJ51]|uniref:M16 family metallopeptidase n=1 Tax=Rheinheimera sp. UJ51 TaxID=2892446 RepID=UPI001E4E3F19|nr:pitrilysin family protein [Rheinheimera sp. UJ51]MCC5451084.1 insulinase family protein [Rheinheimera sp. UJ51]
MKHFIKNKLAVGLVLATSLVLSGCSLTAPAVPVPASNASDNAPSVSAFKLPDYQQMVLPNGLTLYLMPQHEVPLLSVQAVISAGAVLDQRGGEAFLTAQSLLLGAGDKNKQQLEQATDFIGASLNSVAGKEASYLSMNFMQKDTDSMLDILAAVLRQPTFDTTEFSKLHARLVAQQQQAKESPRNVIGSYFDALLYGSHPYAKARSGSEQSLASLDLKAVTEFYQRYYQPDNIAIVVSGDFQVSELTAQLTARFADWQGQSAAKPSLAEVSKPSQARVLLVDKADATETTLMFGGVGVSQNNPDFVGLEVVNTILGGRFTSWLNDELRVNSGLTYGARSGFSALSRGGAFQISTFTRSETSQQTIELALKTYSKLWQQGIDQATLDSAKAYVKGQFPPDYETNSQLANLLGNMHLYQLDKGYINDFEQKVDSLTLADTQRLIQQYFPQQQLQFVLVGKADELASFAQTLGEVTRVSIQADGFTASR